MGTTSEVIVEESEVGNLQEKKRQKIGLVLGPGGLKSFAHIGVIKAFEKENIPIHAVIGLEWGSLPAAIYSQKAKSYDVEWQMFKLKKENLPSGGIFRSKLKAESTDKLNTFLQKALGTYRLDRGKLKFACPVVSVIDARQSWLQYGRANKSLKKCMAFPPIYKNKNNWLADPIMTDEVVAQIRRMGVDKIVYVDVISQSNLFTTSKFIDGDASRLIWVLAQKIQKEMASKVDYYISVNTRKYSLLDMEPLRSYVLMGGQSAHDIVNKIKTEVEY